MHNKKGETTVLETLIITVVGILLFIALLLVLFGLWNVIIKEKKTPAVNDLERIVKNVQQLTPNSAFPVPVLSRKDATFALYSRESDALPPSCNKNTCLCVHEAIKGTEKTECEIFPKITKQCSNDNCEKSELCFTGTAFATGTEGVVFVCRSCTKIALAPSEEECKKLLS